MATKQEEDIDLEPLLNAHQQQLGLVIDEASSIDGKALAILAAITTLLIFIAQANAKTSVWLLWLSVIVPLLGALVFCGLALWPKHYIGPAVELDKHIEYTAMPRETLIDQLLADTEYAIKQNNIYNRQRWNYCVISILLILLAAVSLLVIL